MTAETGTKARGISNPVAIGLLLIFVIVVDVLAFLIVPPFDKENPENFTCEFPVCYINGNLEFPAPHVVWSLARLAGLVLLRLCGHPGSRVPGRGRRVQVASCRCIEKRSAGDMLPMLG